MRIAYSTSADLAKEIGGVWADRKRKAYTWPYNRFKWDDSETWWIVPAPDRVAFQYAKIVVTGSPRVVEAGRLFAGLYVEKGLDRTIAGGVYPQDWLLGPTWRWHNVLRDLANGSFQSAIAEASRRLGEHIDVRLDTHVPLHGPSAIKPLYDSCWFDSIDGTAIKLSHPPVLSTSQGFLKLAPQATTVPELARVLRAIPDGGWAWINFYIGRSVEKSTLHDTSALDAVQLTDRLLEPLAPWIV